MDNKERFDQIERLLAELLRKADRQDEFNAYQREFNTEVRQRLDGVDSRLDSIDGRLDGIDGRLDGIDGRLDGIDGRLDGIVGILKLSAEAHKQSEERQEQMLREIREQGRRTDATQTEILRMMQKWDEQDAQNQTVNQRLASTDDHEPRLTRLEDEVFRKAS